MKNTQKTIILSLALGSVIAHAGPREIARVSDNVLTDRELELSLSSLNQGQREAMLRDKNIREQLIDSGISRKLLVKEAERMKLDQDEEFKEALSFQREQLLAARVLEKSLSSKLGESAVKRYYDSHKDRYSTEQVRVQQIVLSSESEAKKIMKMAKDPKNDFQNLAEKFSKDPQAKNNRGEMGFIVRGFIAPEFTDVAFNAQDGEIVGPVQTTFGYHIVKVIQKRAGKPLEFHEVELRVREDLKQVLIRNYVESLRQKMGKDIVVKSDV